MGKNKKQGLRYLSAVEIMKNLEVSTKPGFLSVRVTPEQREAILGLLGTDVTLSAFTRHMYAAWIKHDQADDGANEQWMSVLRDLPEQGRKEQRPAQRYLDGKGKSRQGRPAWATMFDNNGNGSGPER